MNNNDEFIELLEKDRERKKKRKSMINHMSVLKLLKIQTKK